MSGARGGTLLLSKTAIPPERPDATVERPQLVDRLRSSADRRLVSIVAPAGYGKTTLLTQWAAADPRPFAWLSLDQHDSDPVLLLRYVVTTLEELLPRTGNGRTTRTATAPALVRRAEDLLASTHPCVLVLDDVHLLDTAALDAISSLARTVPPGSQLVLAGRTEHTGLVARWRVGGDLAELGSDDLALTLDESLALVELWGVVNAEREVEELHRVTEGWPGGLYLAALALRSGAELAHGQTVDRFVHDYLRSEHLEALPGSQLTFLLRSSVLDRMRPDLLDAVLERHDSAQLLVEIEQANLFLIPLDRERTWYRYHELFRSVLFDELVRTEPESATELRGRAAAWCEAHGRPEDAMAYAIACGDRERMARLVVALAFALYREGRAVTVERWLELFDDAELLRRHPQVAVIGALAHTLRGHAFQAERWLDAAARAGDVGPLDDGSTGIAAWVAAIEALACRHGVEACRADAARALGDLGPLSPLRVVAMLGAAYGELLAGDADASELRFEDLREAARGTGRTLAAAVAAAQLAVFALERDDPERATTLLDEATASVDGEQFADYPAVALTHAVAARVAIRTGDLDSARRSLQVAQRSRPELTHAMPQFAVMTLLEMVRAYIALDDASAARTLLVQVADVLRRRPDLGVLAEQAETLRHGLDGVGSAVGWESTLTTAELRLLPFLTTHLTFREIGDRLFLSRNTVKTQAISIYRKLGASSRGEAVQRATELGLVESHDPSTFTPSG